MEHNPNVLAIGEIALFLIGVILSVILLAILLLPSLLKFTIPHWVQVRRPNHTEETELPSLFDVASQSFSTWISNRQSRRPLPVNYQRWSTRYHLYLDLENDRLSMFRQGDETERSKPSSIRCRYYGYQSFVMKLYRLLDIRQRAWDQDFHKTNKPFGALMYQLILLNLGGSLLSIHPYCESLGLRGSS